MLQGTLFNLPTSSLPFFVLAHFLDLDLESHRELVGEAVSKVVRVKLCSVQVILIFPRQCDCADLVILFTFQAPLKKNG